MISGPALIEVDSDPLKGIERDIRDVVFIKEQSVPYHIEFDEFEGSSTHFLIKDNEQYVGCIRYRWCGKDIKIERLAILEEHRKKGYGRFALLELLKKILKMDPENIYLHAQVISREFYEKCGFQPKGPLFKEADIAHVRMYYIRRDDQ